MLCGLPVVIDHPALVVEYDARSSRRRHQRIADTIV
jgi:hypothetical protein